MIKLAPSLLAADFSQLGKDVKIVCDAGADFLHIDVMDGHFVPNISYGACVVKSLNNITTVPYDIHLMIANPDLYLKEFVTDKTAYITVHQEACAHLNRTINNIKEMGIKAGVSINPATPVSTLSEVLDLVDLVLVMSVNPGFGGQSFIENSLDKVKELKRIREEKGLEFKIEIDGGVNLDNISRVKAAGVDIAVAGSAVFKAKDIRKRIIDLKNA